MEINCKSLRLPLVFQQSNKKDFIKEKLIFTSAWNSSNPYWTHHNISKMYQISAMIKLIGEKSFCRDNMTYRHPNPKVCCKMLQFSAFSWRHKKISLCKRFIFMGTDSYLAITNSFGTKDLEKQFACALFGAAGILMENSIATEFIFNLIILLLQFP